ncbi:MAG: outer membrane protein [Rhodomicrobium sp.]
MRSILLGAVCGIAFAATANAGDLYAPGGYKDAYVPAPLWTGFYAGIHGGYATGGWDGTLLYNGGDSGIEGKHKLDADGGFGGVQIGYNRQINSLVLGVEADISGSGLSGKGSYETKVFYAPNGSYFKNFDADVDYFGTVRGRIGYSFGNFLPYVTGGLAYGHAHLKNNVYDVHFAYTKDTGDADATQVGWTAGAGVEYALGNHWSIKAEWLYIDLGQQDYRITGTDNSVPYGGGIGPFTSDSFKADLTFNTFKAGLNYKFGGIYEPLK